MAGSAMRGTWQTTDGGGGGGGVLPVIAAVLLLGSRVGDRQRARRDPHHPRLHHRPRGHRGHRLARAPGAPGSPRTAGRRPACVPSYPLSAVAFVVHKTAIEPPREIHLHLHGIMPVQIAASVTQRGAYLKEDC